MKKPSERTGIAAAIIVVLGGLAYLYHRAGTAPEPLRDDEFARITRQLASDARESARLADDARIYHASWIAMILCGLAIASTGVNALQIVEYSVIFAVVVLLFTYYPILRVAGDANLMGRHVNSRIVTLLGWIFLALMRPPR